MVSNDLMGSCHNISDPKFLITVPTYMSKISYTESVSTTCISILVNRVANNS